MLPDSSENVQFTNGSGKEAFSIVTRLSQAIRQNPWRTAFWVLAGLVLAVLITILSIWFSITSPAPAGAPSGGTSGSQEAIPIQATVPLKSINQFVDRQLQNKETPLQEVQLSFQEKLLRVDSKLTFFGRVMEMRILMRPQLQQNGDVRLVAEESSIGSWSIPLKTLFGVLEGLPWPAWVHIQPEQRVFDIKLSEQQTTGPHYRVQSIDTERGTVGMQVLLE